MTKRREEKKKTNEKIDFYKKLTKQVNLSSCKTIIEHLQRNQSKNKYGFFLVFFSLFSEKQAKKKTPDTKLLAKENKLTQIRRRSEKSNSRFSKKKTRKRMGDRAINIWLFSAW